MSKSEPAYDYLFKLLLVGSAKSGKTSMVQRFVENRCISEYTSTIGVDFKTHHIDLEGLRVKLQIWDTAGQERFRNITKMYCRGARGVMVVFDLTSTESFNEVDTFFSMEQECGDDTAALILVGCMADLSENRKVDRTQAEKKAKTHGAGYIEVSAKTGMGVEEAFLGLVKYIVDPGSRPLLSVADPEEDTHKKEGEERNAKREDEMKKKAEREEEERNKKAEREEEERKKTAQIVEEDEKTHEERERLETENGSMLNKLEAVDKLTTILGAGGSMLVENIGKVFAAEEEKLVQIDAEGNVLIQ